jgi:biotin carboxylase
MENSILIFGGGDLQISIIKKAKLLGYKTIVLDPNPNAPGKEYGDKFYNIAGDDFEGTLKVAKIHQIKGVVTAATDHPILMMCRIAEVLDLPFPSFNSCETLLNKGKFKEFLRINSIKHAKGDVYSFEEITDKSKFNFPVILKPVKNSGSRGVLKCEKEENFDRDISECKPFCNNGQLIIEEFIEGDEISVEAFVTDHIVQIIQITDKVVTSPPYNVELGHIQPSKYEGQKQQIKDVLQKIVNKLELNNCVLHPEIKINNGELTVIEIGPRLGGDNITSLLVPLSTGIDMEALQIDIALGKKIKLNFHYNHSLISFLNLPEYKEVESEISLVKLQDVFPDIVDFQSSLKKGDIINPITNSLNRYGYFVISTSNRLDLLEKEQMIKKYLSSEILNL